MSYDRVKTAYWLCAHRDGEQCQGCGWTYGMPLTDSQKGHLFGQPGMPRRERIHLTEKLMQLELHHIDGNPANNPPDGTNWNIQCKVCNLWLDIDGKVERERERERGKAGRQGGEERGAVGEEVEEQVRIVQGSRPSVRRGDNPSERDTVQINAVSFPVFQSHVVAEVIKRGEVEWTDLMRSGAYVAGVSSRKGYTAEEYLNRLTSSAGPLMVIERGVLKLVVLRQPESARESITRRALKSAHNGHDSAGVKQTEIMLKGGSPL